MRRLALGLGLAVSLGCSSATVDDETNGSEPETSVFLDHEGRVLCDPAVEDCSAFEHGAQELVTASMGRLNKNEYNRTVRDLLGTALTPADRFPVDESALGFDTIGATLRVQPEHFEHYLTASAALISEFFSRPATDPWFSRYVTCDLASGAECQHQVIATFAAKAWRRAVSDAELATYFQLVDTYGVDDGIRAAFQAVLLSPNFMYKIERDPDPNDPTLHPVSGFELASRLSYFLWSSMPDDALFNAAASGDLLENAGLIAEFNRMLADPRSSAVVEFFAAQWLNINKVRGVVPDAMTFPNFDDELREAMAQETRLMLGEAYETAMPIQGLLAADYTYVNQRLAEHYGISGVSGDEFVRVPLTGTTRVGLLTHGSFLTGSSNPTRTSPVKRGKYVLERFLCSAPPPPPPDVDVNIDQGSGLEALSVRERLMQHQQKGPACFACHKEMDAIGLALENYDAIGQFRTQDEFGPIDASGTLPAPDGSGPVAFNGVNELVDVLTQDERLVSCMVQNLLAYSLGREFGPSDQALKQVLARAVNVDGNSLKSGLEAIVMNDVFRTRRAEPPAGGQ